MLQLRLIFNFQARLRRGEKRQFRLSAWDAERYNIWETRRLIQTLRTRHIIVNGRIEIAIYKNHNLMKFCES